MAMSAGPSWMLGGGFQQSTECNSGGWQSDGHAEDRVTRAEREEGPEGWLGYAGLQGA